MNSECSSLSRRDSVIFGEPADVYPVALTVCSSYDRAVVERAVRAVLDATGWNPARGCRVLVKPNLLRAVPLCCTHPEVVRAVCLWLLEHGVQVRVADSPGFGTARGVARHIGLMDALRPLGLTVQALDQSRPVALGSGGTWGVSRWALESDALISVPKVKAHCQVRLTLAVKNLFGCVCGLRKAIAHTTQGQLETFVAGVADLYAALPPVLSVADGITAMHGTGPSGGNPYPLGCVGAAASAVALDTALYTLLRVEPERIPLWAELQRRRLPEALPERIHYPLLRPENFDAAGFMLPAELTDISFRPQRLLLSLWRRIWTAVRQR